jgi:hypothetical protein
MMLTRENGSSGEETPATYCIQKNPTWTGMGSNPALLVEGPALSYIDSGPVTNGLTKFDVFLTVHRSINLI